MKRRFSDTSDETMARGKILPGPFYIDPPFGCRGPVVMFKLRLL